MHSPTFSPVYGSVPLAVGASADEVVVVGALEVVLVEVDEAAVGAELLVAGAGVVAVPVGELLRVVVVASGSTYCWSPADVPVPCASAVGAPSEPKIASASKQARIRSERRTPRY